MPHSADIPAAVDLIRSDLRNALIATDFDGTLAPIVDDPALATPIEGSIPVLQRLAEVAGEVAIVSGRPVSYLARFVPEEIMVVGLYGLESSHNGVAEVHSNAGVWRETMSDVATAARMRGPKGMFVESKGLSITLHYRGRPELAEQVEDYAAIAAKSAGLRLRSARMSYELHPPIDEDKGTVVQRLANEVTGPVVYVGDDIGDLPAFLALENMAAGGRTVLKACVSSSEISAEMIERADLVLNGPAAVLEFLSALTA